MHYLKLFKSDIYTVVAIHFLKLFKSDMYTVVVIHFLKLFNLLDPVLLSPKSKQHEQVVLIPPCIDSNG